MQYIVDRFEGRFAVLEAENGELVGVERARLPADTEEGDVLEHRMGCFIRNLEETADRRKRMLAKQEALRKKIDRD